jgi:hypothetical protein
MWRIILRPPSQGSGDVRDADEGGLDDVVTPIGEPGGTHPGYGPRKVRADDRQIGSVGFYQNGEC